MSSFSNVLGSPRRAGKWWRRLALTLTIAALATGISVEIIGISTAVGDLRSSRQLAHAARTTLGTTPATWTPANIAAAERLQIEALKDAKRGASRLRADPLLSLAIHITWLSVQARSVLHLAQAAEAATTALGNVIGVAQAYQAGRSAGALTGTKGLVAFLQRAGPDFAAAQSALDPAVAALEADSRLGLIGPLASTNREALQELRPARDEVRLGAQAAASLPAALGADRPRTYLLLFQNPDELRPTGGYSAVIGLITFDGGKMTSFEVHTSAFYDHSIPTIFPIPAPLARNLTFDRNSLEMSDAAWDPDFPTSAQLIERMYQAATNHTVDGTVALDPYLIAALLQVIGPVDVPVYGQFTSANVFARIEYINNVEPGPQGGKEADGPIFKTIAEAAALAPASTYPDLLKVLADRAKNGHLQASFHDAQLQGLAAEGGYTGAVLQPTGGSDYLMIVDANVGGNKGDRDVVKSTSLTVEVKPHTQVTHHLTIDYSLPPFTDPTDRALNPQGGLYRDYVRIYLPSEASLRAMKLGVDGGVGGGSLDAVTQDHGHLDVGVFFILPRGHIARLTVDYVTGQPAGRTYSLVVQKQAGLESPLFKLTVLHPDGTFTSPGPLTSTTTFRSSW